MRGLFIRSGFMCLLTMVVSVPLSAQNRGAGARGGAGQNPQNQAAHGNTEELAAKRAAIQSQERTAIEQENKAFKDTISRLQSERNSSTNDVERDLLKARTSEAQRTHQANLQKIRTDAQSALAALKS